MIWFTLFSSWAGVHKVFTVLVGFLSTLIPLIWRIPLIWPKSAGEFIKIPVVKLTVLGFGKV